MNALQAEKVLGKFETHGTVLGDLGLASIKLAKFEDEVGTRCGSYTDTATASKAIGSDARRVGMVSACDALSEAVGSTIQVVTVSCKSIMMLLPGIRAGGQLCLHDDVMLPALSTSRPLCQSGHGKCTWPRFDCGLWSGHHANPLLAPEHTILLASCQHSYNAVASLQLDKPVASRRWAWPALSLHLVERRAPSPGPADSAC